jgi:competence protein ComEA
MTWYDGDPPPDPARRRDTAGAPAPVARTTRADLSAAVARRAAPWEDADAVVQDGARRGARVGSGLRWQVPVRTAAVAVAALALVGGAVALRAAPGATGPAVEVPEPLVSASTAVGSAPSPSTRPDVWVHVVGEVAAPGVVALPAGSRVAEAVAAAGGALPGADLSAVNLAAEVVDGAQVRVPAPGEVADPGAEGTVGSGGAAAGAADGAVDVNRADAAGLQTLPGIGPVLAERILAWRSEHGAFATPEDLLDVPGIGPALLARIADRVRV